ncbi:MAG: bifunctional diaminohydroxyphosphoribosylaminopyrimidine deaminase/5-amino-6-(5-phosphoribosylamino)uracil reductase RibD [Chloroflexi bacterium]|nr:bifunctional diaminohydroxyphosphoribosylaminopyrimidine deaminase/5-amino-6-(5-phosphoribosylamino)uracil reductase RibD [Chloroflexota bacterium]
MPEQPSRFMQMALDAAASVRGATSPNPWVGAVAVHNGNVVSVGATNPPPGPHAEAAALAGLPAGAGSELYVTLEPCAPFPGKRTRPCAEAIIEAGIRRVVVALEDPHPGVRGQGIAMLRAAGIEVEIGDGRAEATALLRPYLKHRQTGLPYVIAKFAASLDGRTATASGDSKWITGEAARARGHEQRAWVDAVMVGSGTVLADDPELTARRDGIVLPRQPARIVLDARGRVSPGARLFAAPGKVIVATSTAAPGPWKQALAATGAQVVECEATADGLNLDQLLHAVGERGVMSIWAEGGATLLGSLFDGHHADEVWAFIAPVVIGGTGPGAVAGRGASLISEASRLEHTVIETIGADVLVRGYTTYWRP